MNSNLNKLPREFYERDVHAVAVNLLGKIFIRKINNYSLAGKIVEVEAYDGSIDQASHSYNGRTKRNEVMFKGGGFLYIYFTYGMHFCANVVTGNPNDGKAILLRGIEPINEITQMSINRYGKEIFSEKESRNLTNGPAKITQAFQLGRNENGLDLCGDTVCIFNAPNIPNELIVSTTRIGIKKSVDLPWRYYIKNNPFVSKK